MKWGQCRGRRSPCTSAVTTGQLQRQSTRLECSFGGLILLVLPCSFCYAAVAAVGSSYHMYSCSARASCSCVVLSSSTPSKGWAESPKGHCNVCVLQLLKAWNRVWMDETSVLWETPQVCIKHLICVYTECSRRSWIKEKTPKYQQYQKTKNHHWF